MSFDEVFQAFFKENELIVCEPYGNGHIHETFLLTLQNEKKQFILQKINCSVFKQVDFLQENIEMVTTYLKKETGKDTSGTDTVELIKTIDGRSFFTDNNHEYWRCYNFIPKSRCYDRVETNTLAFEAGKSLGKFTRILARFPADSLNITLPDFHNLGARIQQFEESIEKDIVGRKTNVGNEIVYVREKAKHLGELLKSIHANGIPLRVTHNDPKINNILFDESDQAICLIDLDTVMPGYIYHDFGDAIRTGAASAAEDEPDTSKMFVRIDLFEAYARGFLPETNHLFSNAELSTLPIAPQIMTFIIGLRFLTDYLNGDIYFKTKRENHNLERWYAQKALLSSIEENEAAMQRIIQQIAFK